MVVEGQDPSGAVDVDEGPLRQRRKPLERRDERSERGTEADPAERGQRRAGEHEEGIERREGGDEESADRVRENERRARRGDRRHRVLPSLGGPPDRQEQERRHDERQRRGGVPLHVELDHVHRRGDVRGSAGGGGAGPDSFRFQPAEHRPSRRWEREQLERLDCDDEAGAEEVDQRDHVKGERVEVDEHR